MYLSWASPGVGKTGSAPPLDFMKVKITGVTISRSAKMPNSSLAYYDTSSNKLWQFGTGVSSPAIAAQSCVGATITLISMLSPSGLRAQVCSGSPFLDTPSTSTPSRLPSLLLPVDITLRVFTYCGAVMRHSHNINTDPYLTVGLYLRPVFIMSGPREDAPPPER